MAKKQFKSESKRLLDLMINSIYTNKDIFLRELISNASDALDKLYYRSLTDKKVKVDKDDLEIKLEYSDKDRTITITDNGCGMTKEELESNLGTIAKSGTLEFKENMTQEEKVDIIGQSGVGFYSAFMVSDKITVTSKSVDSKEAYVWESEGVDGYTITEGSKREHGTKIELHLKEPISIKDKIENNSIIVKNIDYFLIYKKTFTQRISELFSLSKESSSRNIKQKNSIVKNENNSINNLSNFSNVDINNDEICLKCNKKNNVLSSECGCKFCEDCLYEILKNITNDQIILNGYEKLQSSMEDTNKCPLCKKSLNLDYLVMLLKNKGRNFEIEYNEAKIRMKNYCKTLCFGCEKKITNGKSLEVSHNSKREMLQVNVMINKHCFKDSKKIKNIDFEEENGIDYTDSPHIVCFGCYKKNKNAKTKSIDEVEYKVITCNICGIRHYVSMKDWDKWHKSDVCCKCNIF